MPRRHPERHISGGTDLLPGQVPHASTAVAGQCATPPTQLAFMVSMRGFIFDTLSAAAEPSPPAAASSSRGGASSSSCVKFSEGLICATCHKRTQRRRLAAAERSYTHADFVTKHAQRLERRRPSLNPSMPRRCRTPRQSSMQT